LLEIFGGWCDIVVDLINATEEDAILRRDIYDRPPIMNWGRGRVTLLGDSVHAMQPNLGQAGCMAIEVCYLISFPWLWNHYHHGGYVVVLRSGTYHNSIVFAGWLPVGCRA